MVKMKKNHFAGLGSLRYYIIRLNGRYYVSSRTHVRKQKKINIIASAPPFPFRCLKCPVCSLGPLFSMFDFARNKTRITSNIRQGHYVCFFYFFFY